MMVGSKDEPIEETWEVFNVSKGGNANVIDFKALPASTHNPRPE